MKLRLRSDNLCITKMQHSKRLEGSTAKGAFVPESVSWAQLEAGDFEVRFGFLYAGPLTLSLKRYNLGFQSEADIRPDTSLVSIVADRRTQARSFGITIDESHLFASGKAVGVSSLGPASFYSASIDLPELAAGFSDVPDTIALLEDAHCTALWNDPLNASRFRAFMDNLFLHGQGADGPLPRRAVYGTLIPLIGTALDRLHKRVIEPSKCLDRRVRAVRTCIAYMREHVDDTITLLDLSRVSKMRSRSLINAFAAVTGFSPMDYLRRLRLNGVRDALRRGNKQTRIIDVAADWGFWHMGHFTRCYRALFGEAPSRTLSNS
ncbi:MAG: helix-turn-helix domain-containing protein [Candidatus Eremiobacteraeota bacterium]|nr:helix-turn-helix domain-containing protein [Candidatus Eremiobacteraeota bacterium]